MDSPSLDDVEARFTQAPPEQQRIFLAHLPRLLRLSSSDIALLKAAEGAFEFWDNPDDATYDRL
jgi:hypothetical protein